LTGNPFSAGGVESDDSLSEEDSHTSVEPIFDDHHFPDLEQRNANKGYSIVAQRDIFFSSIKNNMTSTASRIFKNNWMRLSKTLCFVRHEQINYLLKPKA